MPSKKIVLIGTGWRSEFFLRIAQQLPERFSICGVYTRSEEKKQQVMLRFGIPAFTDYEKIQECHPDYVILCVKRGCFLPHLKQLFCWKIPVLCEVPPAETLEDLNHIYQMAVNNRAKIQFVEQYPFWPLYSSWLRVIEAGAIGEVQSVSLSALHGYHAAGIARKLLQTKHQGFEVWGSRTQQQVITTKDRSGDVLTGQLETYNRDRLTVRFEAGKQLFYDFSFPQYRSYLRSRHLLVTGTMGEIDDFTLRCLDKGYQPVQLELQRLDHGKFDNNFLGLRSLHLGKYALYTNPFGHARLNDDELATAACMQAMENYLDNGVSFYPIQEALQDAYLSLMMTKALETGQKCIGKQQEWNRGE